MASYKCGWCGKFNENDIWCSEHHRQLWYADHRAELPPNGGARAYRKGPKHQIAGNKRRTQRTRKKKS